MPKPLTRKNSKGESFDRLSTVDDDIARWEVVAVEVVASAARNLNHRAGDYIKNEVLLSMLRAAGKNERGKDYYALFPVFMVRVKLLIRQLFAQHPNLDELVEETSSELAAQLAEDAANATDDTLDFFEVRFGNALKFLVLSHLEKNQRWYSKHQTEEDPSEDGDHFDVTAVDDSHELTGPERAAFAMQIDRVFHALTDEERAVVALRYLDGMKTSSNDEGEQTIPKKLNLSERTVRNRLTSAIKKLSKFKERP
ncbi:RNA polymerase sigma factor [Paraburkholderia pallida]|uniref:RNA polymerase sigma-70 region 4 domain-containing protein n=1 Tax=Paraburkholderia pallida TaxID=2547399 RepID=A0A4P7D1C0_9BURK|nr:sigma factor-like helix-turn-helix DNA-binding protein [Paraburkholderia pallida]QBR02491.1 hypothetical protein E1956_35200 [Paraburkholderia pallida]